MFFSKISGQQICQNILFVCCIIFFLFPAESLAQFTFTNTLKGEKPSEVIVGGGGAGQSAIFTSGTIDPQGAGWLRLNDAAGNHRGFAYVDKSFPSTLGVLVEFEYKAWRDVSNSDGGWHGGDGFTVFLFDATVPTFRLGGWGGSLAYAPNTAASPKVDQGLAGGYIGLGFDSYGNYGVNTEGKNGGIAQDANNHHLVPNTVILRGPTTNNVNTTNRYLAGVKLGNRSGEPFDIRQRGEVDYDPFITSRPTDQQFYRRVQIEIKPVAGGTYNIIVRWKRSNAAGPFTQLINYTTTDIPPSLMKVGFAAATGGAINYHEVRNLLITTPGNLRLNKVANRDIIRTVPGGTNANTISYTIEVHNDTPSALTNVIFKDSITDGVGKLLSGGSAGVFRVTSISHTGFNAGTVLPTASAASPLPNNIIQGSLNMAAGSVGYITVTGTLHSVPAQNILKNTANVVPTDISDPDLENNTATVSTVVIAEKVDMVVSHSANQDCILPLGNTFTTTISNLGSLNAQFGGVTVIGGGNSRTYNRNRLELVHITPPGVSFSSSTIPSGWEFVGMTSNSPSTGYTTRTYRTTFTTPARDGSDIISTPNNKTLGSGLSMPNFQFVLSGSSQYNSEVRVRFIQEIGTVSRVNNSWSFGNPTSIQVIEPEENRMNNSAEAAVYPAPTVAPSVSSTIYYCLGDEASPLTANKTDSMYSLRWYSSENGVPLNNTPVPITNAAGTTRYFVSQVNGECEGPLATIDVVVLATPTAGTIGGQQTICLESNPSVVSSSAAGTAPGWPAARTLSYRWEVSNNEVDGWSVIPGATTATYTPATLTSTRYYRRTTVASIGGKTCFSAPTNVIAKFVNTVDAGEIAGVQTLCEGTAPGLINSVVAGSGAGTISYQWQQSANGTNGWSAIAGAVGETYTPVVTNSSMYYRRVTTSTLNGVACVDISNVVIKEVLQASPGAISGDQTVCSLNKIATITSTSVGSSIAGATIAYRWEESSSVDNAGWTIIDGAIDAEYTPSSKSRSGEYRYRRVMIVTKNSVSCEVSTTEVTVIVKNCSAITNPMLRSRALRSQ